MDAAADGDGHRAEREVVHGYRAPYPDPSLTIGSRAFHPAPADSPDNPMYPACNAAWDVFDVWTKPVLTIFSDQDAVAPDGWKPIVARIPGATDQPHVILEGGGHFLQEDIGEAYTDALMAWLGSRHLTASRPRLGNPEWVDNWTVGSGLRMEFIDALGQVWLCHEPVTEQRARTLASRRRVALRCSGGPSPMPRTSAGHRRDRRRPLDTMEVDGLRFSFVARPVGHERVAGVDGDVDRQAPHDALRRGRARSTCSTSATAPSPRPHGARRTTHPIEAKLDLPNGWTLRTAELTAISSPSSPTRPRSPSSATGRASTAPAHLPTRKRLHR